MQFEAEDRSTWYCLVRSGCTGYSLIGWRGYTGPGGLHQLHRARLVKGAATRWNGQTDPPLAPRQATSRNGPAGKCWQISEGKQSGQIHVDKEANGPSSVTQIDSNLSFGLLIFQMSKLMGLL